MTEREKQDAGLLYDANNDPALRKERERAQELCFSYNLLPPSRQTERETLLRSLLGRTGAHFCIEPSFFCDYGYRITIGESFFMNYNCVILDCADVTFGDFVFVAPCCGFYTAGHPLDAAQRALGLEFARPITVGNHVWIGAHTAVLPGVTIGDGAVIGAGSVVTGDIPPNVLAFGNPCKIRRVFTAFEPFSDTH